MARTKQTARKSTGGKAAAAAAKPAAQLAAPAAAPATVEFRATGAHSELASTAATPFLEGGVEYKSAEHYYQAAKFPGREERILRQKDGAAARKLGRRAEMTPFLRPDWEAVREDVFFRASRAKFWGSPTARRVLLDTGDKPLVFATVNEGYWGNARGRGANRAGRTLERVRAELRADLAAGRQEPRALPPLPPPTAPVKAAGPPPTPTDQEQHIRAALAALGTQAIEPEQLDFDAMLSGGAPPLGHGHYGTVYRSRFRGGAVAVKLVNLGVGMRLRDVVGELSVMSGVASHPHVITFYGAGVYRQRFLFLVSELAQASVEARYIADAERELPFAELARMAAESAAGLVHLHAEGVVHRDVAARNLLLDASGRVKICDFGLSRIVQVGEETNTTASARGPLKWMAPEALSADASQYSPRSDVYMFGVALWEMLCRSPPHPGLQPMQAALLVLQSDLRPAVPAALRAAYPRFVALMERCWARDAQQRPSAAEALAELDAIASGAGRDLVVAPAGAAAHIDDAASGWSAADSGDLADLAADTDREPGCARVAGGQFWLCDVPRRTTMTNVCAEYGLVFQPGRGYYQLTRPENVGAAKLVVARHDASGAFTTDAAAARALVGLAPDVVRVRPSELTPGYTLFVQSTSHSRLLPLHSQMLVSVSSSPGSSSSSSSSSGSLPSGGAVEVPPELQPVVAWLEATRMSSGAARHYALRLGAEGFDTPEALATLTEQDMLDLDFKTGHRRLVHSYLASPSLSLEVGGASGDSAASLPSVEDLDLGDGEDDEDDDYNDKQLSFDEQDDEDDDDDDDDAPILNNRNFQKPRARARA